MSCRFGLYKRWVVATTNWIERSLFSSNLHTTATFSRSSNCNVNKHESENLTLKISHHLNSWLLEFNFMMLNEIEQVSFVENSTTVGLKKKCGEPLERRSLEQPIMLFIRHLLVDSQVFKANFSWPNIVISLVPTHLITSSLLINHVIVHRSQSCLNIRKVRFLNFLKYKNETYSRGSDQWL